MSKIILVTGATDGIGRETAQALAKEGARVLVHGRSQQKVDEVVQALRQSGGEADGLVADLGSFAAVRKMAAEVASLTPKLDVLLNNAGVFMNERKVTPDGHEATLQVNHLSHFLLTQLLLPLLEKAAPARVVNVSSVAHNRGKLEFDDLEAERGFSGYGAYANSKLANVLFTVELAERVKDRGITVNALHPGVISTKLLKEGFGAVGSDVASGAKTSLHLALSPEVEGVTGSYFSDARPAQMGAEAQDPEARRRLWEVSERMTGLQPA